MGKYDIEEMEKLGRELSGFGLPYWCPEFKTAFELYREQLARSVKSDEC